MHGDVKSGRTQGFGGTQRLSGGCVARVALMHDIDVASCCAGQKSAIADEFEQALDTDREPHGRCRLAAKQLDQAVVAAATADRSLGAEFSGDPFEHREIVVVEPADQARIDGKRDVGVMQILLQFVEMRT